MALSPNGNILAIGERGGTIFLWDISNPHAPQLLVRLGSPRGNRTPINGLAFNSDGTMLAAGNKDHTIKLWDVTDPQVPVLLGSPLTGHDDWVFDITFSPDGKLLTSGSADGSIILWNVDPQSWAEKICQRVGRNFSHEEWKQYFPNEEYRATCTQWTLEDK